MAPIAASRVSRRGMHLKVNQQLRVVSLLRTGILEVLSEPLEPCRCSSNLTTFDGRRPDAWS